MIITSLITWPEASFAADTIAVPTSLADRTLLLAQPGAGWAVPLHFGSKGSGEKPATDTKDEPLKQAQEIKREKKATKIHKGRIRRPAPPIIPPQTPRQGEARC